MENEMMARPEPPRRTVWVVVTILALIGMIGAVIYAERKNVANFLTKKKYKKILKLSLRNL